MLVSILFFTTHFEKYFSHQKLSFLSYEKVPCITKNISSGGCSVCDPTKHFSHPSFVILFFFQPTHKTKTMTANRWRGVVTIKQAKKHVRRSPKLYKNYNFVRCIFVVPLLCHVNHGM